MYRWVNYTESMQAEWDKLALAHGTVFHTTAFRRILLRAFGYRCRYHAVLDGDGRLCALVPLVEGRNLGLKKAAVALPFVNYVDVCAGNEAAFEFALDALAAYRTEARLSYIELRCKERKVGRPGWSEVLQHYTFVLPLAEGEEQVLARSSASNRNHVRKVYKNGWFTASFDPAHLDAFYGVYQTRMKQLGSPSPDIRFFRSFLELLPAHCRLLTVHDAEAGGVIGGMLLLASPSNGTLYYPYGASLVEYNSKYANNFMYWEAVRYGIGQGLRFLDLGRSQAGSGTYKYKQQWGAEPQQLQYAVYTGSDAAYAAPDKQRLQLFVELWKSAPSFITNRVGPRLIKYVLP